MVVVRETLSSIEKKKKRKKSSEEKNRFVISRSIKRRERWILERRPSSLPFFNVDRVLPFPNSLEKPTTTPCYEPRGGIQPNVKHSNSTTREETLDIDYRGHLRPPFFLYQTSCSSPREEEGERSDSRHNFAYQSFLQLPLRHPPSTVGRNEVEKDRDYLTQLSFEIIPLSSAYKTVIYRGLVLEDYVISWLAARANPRAK